VPSSSPAVRISRARGALAAAGRASVTAAAQSTVTPTARSTLGISARSPLATAARSALAAFHRALAAPLLAALFLLAAACAPPSPPPERPLRIALFSDPLTLDPHLRNELLTFSVLRNIYEALTAFDAGTRIGPALAESWENPNELTWIFHLRRGVRFHDGRELTAKDVLFSFDRARNGPNSNVGSYLVVIERVRALDAHTLEITTARPYPILLNKLAFVFIVPAGAPAEIHQPVGTGPYRLAAYEPGRRLALRAFTSYWGGAPPLTRVEFLPIADLETRLSRLLAGKVDIAQEPGIANAERIRSAPGCRLIEQDSLGVTFLVVRRDRAPFADARVRRALDVALDRRALVAAALHGRGMPVGQMVGRNVFGYAPGLEPPAPDPAGARALLAAAGHPRGLDLEVRFRPGRGPEVEAVRRQLLPAGVRLRLVERPWGELFQRLLAGDVDFYFGAWFCLSGDASDFFDAMVHSRSTGSAYGASNFIRYANPRLDALIEQSATTLDLLARRAQLERCMRVLMDDLAFIPLYSASNLFATRADLDWQPRRDGLILANTIRRRQDLDFSERSDPALK
jgi:peptide/nickel transport system substrate-binding protein